ncbi:MAG: hypothetical protein K2W82_09965 [Candidatus Obscuribacterales bacterium]|nr:hypothetical protein [Candidatus Obscuribacterales bacterium]
MSKSPATDVIRPNSRKQRFMALCLLMILSLTRQTAAYANDFNAIPSGSVLTLTERVAATDRAIFIELVKMAKFNLHFHLEANRHQKWRGLSYPIGREAGTSLTFAATLIDLKQQARGLNNPANISRNELKNALVCGITGNALSGSASSLELAQNTWIMLKEREKGHSPKRSLTFIKNIVAETDRLLEIRAQLEKEEPSLERRKIIDLETKLIQRIRQQLLFEFGTWSCHSRDQAWRENTFYSLDALQNFLRMSAGVMALKAFEQPHLARSSVIFALVSNSLATVNPIVRNYAGIAIRKHQRRKLAKEIQFERPSMTSTELDDLQQQLSLETNQDWLRKVSILNARTEKLDAALDRETKDINRYRQIAQQQSISGPLIGLTGVASSTLATVAVYGYPHDPTTAIRLGFAGRITQGTGQAYALINTPYTIIKGMIRSHRLSKRGELPSQILQERLKRLDDLSRLYM